jgi:site-specific DNA-methyltransferase (adenine-specific)
MEMGGGMARYIDALRSALAESDMMAYLVMMAVRLAVLQTKLKSTGNLFLHCDPTASHYLKIILDAIFDVRNFKNEIIWQRTTPKGHAFTRFPSTHDVILFYTHGKSAKWRPQFTALKLGYVESHYSKIEPKTGRRYRLDNCLNPNPDRPNLTYEWNGLTRVWRWEKQKMRALNDAGRLVYTAKSGMPQYKRYLDESKGAPVTTVWTDIPPVNSQAEERVGYPTQKPLPLLNRIIAATTDPGDLVLDPFCGCGTTIEAAETSGRQWIGIDIAIHAVKVIETRLGELEKKAPYEVLGIPRDFESAHRLAEKDKYQFQWWANYLFNPHALREQKKGRDRGVDGELFFPNGPGRSWGRMLTSVKGGETVSPSMVRDFARVLDREKAEMGLFIFLYPPTQEMIREAASCRFADTIHGDIPRLQIVAIEEWFKGKKPELPPLEHLPSAAFSVPIGRQAPKPDLLEPQLPLSFLGNKPTEIHFNPDMVRSAATSATPKKHVAAKRRSKTPTPEQLRRAPPLPPMALPGGKLKSQPALDLKEPLLSRSTQKTRPRGRA